MTIVPQRDRLLIRRDERDSITKGGIILPDVAKGSTDRPQKGTVVAVGPGIRHFSEYHMTAAYDPIPYEVGDVVIFTKYAGEGMKVGDEEVFLVKEEDIIATIEPDEEPAANLPPGWMQIETRINDKLYNHKGDGPVVLTAEEHEHCMRDGRLIDPAVAEWRGE